jgi:calmodulin
VDADSKDVVEFVALLVIMAAMTQAPLSDDEIRAQFRNLDKDGNGNISATEIREVLTKLGDKLTDEEIDEMIRDVDTDGDGEINFEEFLAHMRSEG